VNAKFADEDFRVNPAIYFINETGGFYHFWKKVSVGCAWNAWRGCYVVVWDGRYWRKATRMMGGEWRCIDELLKRK
jgi:hypothetical protein